MSANPQFVEVTLKIQPEFYNDILQLAKYIFNFSRETPNPTTGKLEPILNKPDVESFMAFATKSYFKAIQALVQQEYLRRAKAMSTGQQKQGV